MTHHLSRREFGTLVTVGAVAGCVTHPLAFAQRAPAGIVTAADIIARIKQNIGVEWKAETVDSVKAGDPSVRVTGVATTAMATLGVLQQAVKSGANMVITFEPTFYSRADAPTPPAGRGGGRGAAGAPANQPAAPRPADLVFAAKNDFIARNNLIIFRLSDHWRARTPDPLAQGLANTLGWSKYQAGGGDARRFDVPASSLEALAAAIKKALQSRGGIRVIGDPQARVQRVALLPGSIPIQASLETLPTVDVIVAGEIREWESSEYTRDAIFAGQRKGLIVLGRAVSEEPGMALCADWLETVVTEVPVRHISAGDLYWRPA